MCRRFVTTISAEILAAQFGLKEVPILETHYNVAPGRRVGVIHWVGGRSRIDLLTWGILPNVAPGQDPGVPMINADSERIGESPPLLEAFASRRCIVPVSGFYEWPHQGERRRQPCYFHMTDHSPLCLAAVCTENNDTTDDRGSFCLLVTGANRLVGELHDRMPVILPPEAYQRWLAPDTDPDSLRHLLQPYPDEALTAYRVPELVNNTRYDSRACIVKV